MKGEICFEKNKNDRKGMKICFKNGSCVAKEPAELEIHEADGGRTVYKSGYEQVEKTERGYVGIAEITTKNGSRFLFKDCYRQEEREWILSRKVTVENADGHDAGFSTCFAVSEENSGSFSEYEMFIPGIWYRKNENVVAGAFGSDPDDRYFLMRVTRMAMPYAELYHTQRKQYLALKHVSPVPDIGMKEPEAGWLTDASFQYASLGIRKAGGVQLCYNFPGSEGEKNYIDRTTGWARRSHPVRQDVKHEYTISISGGEAVDSYEALRTVWRYFYKKETPEHVRADQKMVYEDGIRLLDTYCQEYNGAMGIPFWTTVPEGTVCDISFQIGFVGQQTMCAYQLLRYGYRNHDSKKIEKAFRIIDFWVNESAKDSVLPRVWYNAFPDTFRKEYPTYTRTAADGMEGILVCALLAEQNGQECTQWKEFCIRYGNWMSEHQNEDGSWYRAYDEKGYPVHTGKFNTSNVVRFLVNLYWWTGDQKYRAAAEKAGEFCLKHIYQPMQFVGGTADNDNTIDKEAGMIAVYAFNALYEMTGDRRYLDAACGAADFCETWTYVWRYPVYPYKGNAVFDKVTFTGLSLIATGHSHADVMMGYMPYEYYRLWLWTGDEHYLEFCRFLNGNTKQTTDWNRKLGHYYPGLVEESGELAMQYHNGLGRWLPWCTIAEIESLTRMEEKCGELDVEAVLRMEKMPDRREKIMQVQSSWLGRL